jgi:hypothetical protein
VINWIGVSNYPSLQWSFRKIHEIRPVPINRLDADSECAAAAAQTLRCSLANRRFRRSHIVVYSIVSVSARSAVGSGLQLMGPVAFLICISDEVNAPFDGSKIGVSDKNKRSKSAGSAGSLNSS